MSREMEDRLRAAYQAKADQVTDRRLAQLRAERTSQLAELFSEDVPIVRLEHLPVQLDSRRKRHSRWFAPAVAAAAVAAVAAAAFALSTPGSHRANPAPPASRASSSSPSASPTTSSEPTANKGPSSPPAGPSYLPAGQTGTRDDVPWSAVGAGWRLVQPAIVGAKTSALYLYDPAGGRYLISDQLPGPANLTAWSPDGQRAMVQTYGGDSTRLQELDLRTGQLATGFTQYQGAFVSYTQPRGLAVIVEASVQGASRVLRYGTDGTMQLIYPPGVVAGGPLTTDVLYSADGSQFVASVSQHSELITNGGELVRQYPLPRPTDRICQPLRWWTADSFLEACGYVVSGAFPSSLYLQSVAGDAPTPLTPQDVQVSSDYDDAWPLSNGDVLLERAAGCGVSHYDVLHPDDTIVPLRMPAGVQDPTKIATMNGDLATFRVLKAGNCGGSGPENALISYDMVSGATSTLLAGDGSVVGYPGS